MSKAILTVVSGDKFEKIWQRSEPFFIKYAERCDADLLVLKGTENNLPSPHWIKFSIRDLLKKDYDRIAFVDADIIIRDDAPSLFDIVPEDQFGIFNEGAFTPRNVCIYEVMKVYNVKDFKYDGTTYYNTGVMVASRKHRHIFKVNDDIKPLRNSFGEQTYLNMKIMLSGEKIFPLHYKFNRLSIMDRITGMSRLDSYLIHYAGDGDKLLEKMDRDIERWKYDAPGYKYKKKLFIWALGGIGDVIAAEPTIRYIRNRIHRDADIWVMSRDYPCYEHIEGINLSKDYPKGEFDAVTEMNTHQLPWEGFGKYAPFQFTHCADWVSMCCLGRMLPDKDKQIQLSFADDDLKAVLDICPDAQDLVLVHPGVGWETKTFPVSYWQKIIDELIMNGFKVGIIGKRVNDQHSVLEVDASQCVDFRDKLTLKQLFALIASAKILITNDSAPVHIAGAFDNYIVLIPTCKHPDHIMPYRNGVKYYKAKALYKKLIEDDVFFEGEPGSVWQAKALPEGRKIDEYLPDVEEVILTTLEFDDEHEKSCLSYKKGEMKNGYNPLELH